MVQCAALGSPLPRLLWTIQLGAWENASELLSYLEQPGRCSLPSTIWHLPGSLLHSSLVQSHSTSLRPSAPKTFPYLTGTYFSSHSIFIPYLLRLSETLNCTFKKKKSTLSSCLINFSTQNRLYQ